MKENNENRSGLLGTRPLVVEKDKSDYLIGTFSILMLDHLKAKYRDWNFGLITAIGLLLRKSTNDNSFNCERDSPWRFLTNTTLWWLKTLFHLFICLCVRYAVRIQYQSWSTLRAEDPVETLEAATIKNIGFGCILFLLLKKNCGRSGIPQWQIQIMTTRSGLPYDFKWRFAYEQDGPSIEQYCVDLPSINHDQLCHYNDIIFVVI